MLKVTLSGKTIASPDNKIMMSFNGNEVPVERIGNMIYVNGTSINVAIVEKKSRTLVTAVKLVGGVGVLGYAAFLAFSNQEWLMTNVPAGATYMVDYISTMTSDIIGFFNGLLSSSEPAAVPTDVTGQ